MGRVLAQGKALVSDPPSLVSITAAPKTLLVDWTAPVAESVEVALYSEFSANGGTIPICTPCYAGDLTVGQSPPIPAFFTIEYGFGGIVRRRVVDASSARIFLGVCDNVRVFVTRWLGSTAWPNMAQEQLLFSASVGVSSGGSYDELCSTVALLLPDAAAVDVSLQAPSGAYAWEAGVSSPDSGSGTGQLWGSTQPDLQFSGETTEAVTYRFATYQIIPSVRRFKVPWRGLRIHTNTVVLTDTLAVFVRWYLNS